MIRIGILGAGTAGVTAAMAWINESQKDNIPCEVTCIHDPLIPSISVGEGTASPLLTLLNEVIDFKPLRDINEFNGTFKWGTWYDGFGKDKFNIWHNQPAIHLDASKFPKFVLSRLNEIYNSGKFQVFKEIHDTVISCNTSAKCAEAICKNGVHQFDFIIDCSGFPTTEELENECELPPFETVNSAIIFPDYKQYNEQCSSALAHEHGWMFGIPLTHRKANGFLYNNAITSYDEAVDSFKKLNNLTDDDIKNTRNISWKWFHRKYVVKERIVYSGNKLYFYEPSHALALLYYYYTVREHAILVLTRKLNPDAERTMNNNHLKCMNDFFELHCLYYQGSTHLNSKFWKETRIKTSGHLQQSTQFKFWLTNCKNGNINHYSFHPADIMKTWIESFIESDENFYNKFLLNE